MTSDQNSSRLLSVASRDIYDGAVVELGETRLLSELTELLRKRNGFAAFESALLVRGVGSGPHDLMAWNSADGWRADYEGLADGLYFFAEDAIGVQFAVDSEVIVSFDPETGDKELVADSIDGWAQRILSDVNVMTGYPLAHDWQAINGALPLGRRLVPKIPFVLGGEFAPENLYAADEWSGMAVRAHLAVQIRDLPDGTRVDYRVAD